MKQQKFRCEVCAYHTDQPTDVPIGESIDFPCPQCGGLLRRIVGSFGIARPFEPHFNYSVGHHVNSMQHFKESLKHHEEDYFLQTGGETKLTPVDAADVASASMTDEGMEETRKVQRDSGLWTP